MNFHDRQAEAKTERVLKLLYAQLDRLYEILYLCLNEANDQDHDHDHEGMDNIREKFQDWLTDTSDLLSRVVHPQKKDSYISRLEKIANSAPNSKIELIQQVLAALDLFRPLVGLIEDNHGNLLSNVEPDGYWR